MNIKISINMTILSMLSEFEHAQAENKSQLRQDLLYQLVSLSKSLPYPASGHTYQRWQLFAQIAGYDLSLAKLFESHHDALSILNELGYQEKSMTKLGRYGQQMADRHLYRSRTITVMA